MTTPPPPIPTAPKQVEPATWKQVLLFLVFLLGPVVLATGAAFMGLLMMAFASDAGIRDDDLAARMVVAYVWSCVVFGTAGLPLALSVFAPPSRRRRWRQVAFAIGALAIVAALVFVGFYMRAVM